VIFAIAQDEVEEMDLCAGRRVLLELDDGGTAVALIDRADGKTLELEVLDSLPESLLETVTVVGILVTDAKGLHRWPATGTAAPNSNKATVEVTGTASVLQRRRHPRHPVELPATVRRLCDSQSTVTQPGHIVDLSRGGLKLIAGPVDIGDTVLISVDIRDRPLELVGRVLLAYPDDRGNRVAHVAFLVPSGPSEPEHQLDAYLDTLMGAEPAVASA
jgi:PilZ domain